MLIGSQGKRWRKAQSGISIVELLIGVAIGLIVVAGGLTLLANFTNENRRLLLEARLNQDLRAAMDLVTRDIRRAGHWQGATGGIWVEGGPATPPQNNYRFFYQSACNASPLGASAPSPAAAASSVCYTLAGNTDNVVDANEYYGFHASGGILYAVIAGSAQQPVTDPATIRIDSFAVTPNPQTISMAGYCRTTCTVNCPRVIVREFDILLEGTSPSDASLRRQLRSSVRVRNDYYDGQCPAS
jgi:prepilin peptidase dependent protein B